MPPTTNPVITPITTAPCAVHSACFCSFPFIYRDSTSAEYFSEAKALRDRVNNLQSIECGASAAVQRVKVLMPSYGLGGSILDHVRRLVPILAGSSSSSLVPVPAYDHFFGKDHNPDAYLWAYFDDALPCESWYDCYWEPLVSPTCTDRNNLTDGVRDLVFVDGAKGMPRKKDIVFLREMQFGETDFERTFGSILFGAALLNAWWRPKPALEAQVQSAVRRIHHYSSRVVDATHGGSLKCVAVHIRRGDACLTQWRRCPSLTEYLDAARSLARRFRLTSLFVATEDGAVIDELTRMRELQQKGNGDPMGPPPHTNDQPEPWGGRMTWQEYDRAPFNATAHNGYGTRFWVEQRLRWSKRGERPLGRLPVLQFLVDLEAASRCKALVGTMDSHGSRLMLLRMAGRLGAVPPYISLVAPMCPLTTLPGAPLWRLCSSHLTPKEATESKGQPLSASNFYLPMLWESAAKCPA